MLDFVEGEIVSKEPQRLVLRTGGLGFALKVSGQTLSVLPPPGNTATLYTSLQLREDDISLYGFFAKEERSFFELLIQVSGIGPRLALAVLSAYPAAILKKALATGDTALLTGIAGIGKKTAQRMILELKDKLGREAFAGGEPGAGGPEEYGGRAEIAQAAEALEALGYTRAEAFGAFAGGDAERMDLERMDVEALIKLGLRRLAGYR